MATKEIVIIPNQILLQKSDKVKEYDAEVKQAIQDLVDTLRVAKEPEGAGIAANQIGVTKRICVVRNFVDDPANPKKTLMEEYVLVNPKIISTSKETDLEWEGCLSVPDTYGKVERYKKIKVTALDATGHELKMKANGYFARTIQHEVDHLDGILFTDKVIGPVITEEELDKLL